MIRRRTLGVGAALAFLGSAALLVSGHPLLNWPERGLPIGTLAAGALVSGLGALPLALTRPGSRAVAIAKGAFALAAAWLPVSLLLAGNLRLNFEPGGRSDGALWFSVAVIVGVAVAALAALGSWFTGRRPR